MVQHYLFEQQWGSDICVQPFTYGKIASAPFFDIESFGLALPVHSDGSYNFRQCEVSTS